MITTSGELTKADRKLLAKAMKRAEKINKRESDAAYRGLANVLKAASTGGIVKKS